MFTQILATTAGQLGHHPLVVDASGRTFSAIDLDQAANRQAARFAAQGIGEGCVVALRIPSDLAFIVAFSALAKLGAITAGINPKLAAAEQAALIELAQPTLVVDDPQSIDIRSAATAAHHDAPPLNPDDDRVVALVFTSGTTGTPKAAVYTNATLRAVRDLDLGSQRTHVGGGAAMFVSTQMAHVGFMTKLPWYVQRGITLHLVPKWRADTVLDVVSRHRMPVVGGVAPQIALLLNEDLRRYDLSAVQLLIVGGAASPPALVDDARRAFGAAYSIRYSSTESGGIGLENRVPASGDADMDTLGFPRAGVTAEVRRPDGERCEADEVGELVLRSPAVMAGYWRNPAATASTIIDGWLHTGDLAHTDETGRITLAGRRTEMYIRGGYNVFPMEVEAVLSSHPAVAAVAVTSVPHPVLGEIGLACVVPADPARPPTLDDLVGHLSGRLTTYKWPERLLLVDELPLTPMQKVDRARLRASFELNGTQSSGSTAGTRAWSVGNAGDPSM